MSGDAPPRTLTQSGKVASTCFRDIEELPLIFLFISRNFLSYRGTSSHIIEELPLDLFGVFDFILFNNY